MYGPMMRKRVFFKPETQTLVFNKITSSPQPPQPQWTMTVRLSSAQSFTANEQLVFQTAAICVTSPAHGSSKTNFLPRRL